MDVRVLTSWWQELSSQRLKQLLSILQLTAANFEYKVSAFSDLITTSGRLRMNSVDRTCVEINHVAILTLSTQK